MYKNINYFQDYFHTTAQISQHPAGCKTRRAHLLNCIFLYKAFHYLFLSLWSPFESELKNALHNNFWFALVPNRQINAMATAATLLQVYYFQKMYLQSNQWLICFLKRILIHRNDTFFINTKYKGKDVCSFVRHFCLRGVSLFQSFVLMEGNLNFF